MYGLGLGLFRLGLGGRCILMELVLISFSLLIVGLHSVWEIRLVLFSFWPKSYNKYG